MFLAGGLDLKQLKNEGKVIGEIFDFIDVNSGIEDQQGFKNKKKIIELIEFVKDLF